MLSSNAIAAKKDYATEEALFTEIAARQAGDAAEATARDAAISSAVADVLPPFPTATPGVFELVYDAGNEVLSWSLKVYNIGDKGPAGGVIFYVNDDPSLDFKYLEAAPEDIGLESEWGCYLNDIPGAEGTAISTGAQNTVDILAVCLEPPIAASIADDYELNGYTDWFLPSIDELDELYLKRNVVGGFNTSFYWSSTETGSLTAWLLVFNSGFLVEGAHEEFFKTQSEDIAVRAIRAF